MTKYVIAGYNIATNNFIGYKSIYGEWTENEKQIKYFKSYEDAGNTIDTQDDESTGIREVIETK